MMKAILAILMLSVLVCCGQWNVNDPASVVEAHSAVNRQLNSYITNHYTGKSDAGKQWMLYTGGAGEGAYDMMRNTNCWLYPVDVSGECPNRFFTDQEPHFSLITSKHAVTAWHTTGNIGIGQAFWFRGSDGKYYTNTVAAKNDAAGDIAVITFNKNFPSVVQPFMVMTTNYVRYMDSKKGVDCIWYRYNSGHCNVESGFWINGSFVFFQTDKTVFSESIGTTGDSSSPIWLLATNRLVLLAVQGGPGAGSFISYKPSWEAVLPYLGSNEVSYFDPSTLH